jgi:hypothetical protein
VLSIGAFAFRHLAPEWSTASKFGTSLTVSKACREYRPPSELGRLGIEQEAIYSIAAALAE